MLGLLTLTGLIGCMYAVYWLGREWVRCFALPSITPAAEKSEQVKLTLRNTGIVIGAFVVTYFASSFWPPFVYVLYLPATIFLGWRLKEDGPFWWAAYQRKAAADRLRAAAELQALNTPIAIATRALDAMQQRDPYRLSSAVHGSARFAWVQHFNRDPRDLFVDTPIAQAAAGVEEEKLWPWYGYMLGALGLHDEADMALPIRFAGDGHRLIVGPPGTGKFHSGLAPLLIDSRLSSSSMIVFDPKDGELTIKTAGRRSQWSYIAVLDPYGITGLTRYSFNPFDLLKADDENLIQKVEDIREALLIPSANSKDGDFWDIQARRWLDAIIIHVATCSRETNRTLMRVAELTETFVPVEVLAAMEINPAGNGIVQRYAQTIKSLKFGKDAQRWNDICLTVQKSLFWLNTPQLRHSLEKTDFDVADLIYGRDFPGTLYIALPEKARSNAMAWLRVLYASMIDRLKEQPPNPHRHVHVVIDEFANLGRLERVKSDLATTRGRFWHYHVAVQSLAQLRDVYGEGWEQLLGQCAIEQVLGVGDNFTAEYYSKAAGQTTRVFQTRSDSINSGTSSGYSGGHNSSGSNSGSSTSYNQNIQGVPLLDVGAIRGLQEGVQLVFRSNTPIVGGVKVNAYLTDAEHLNNTVERESYYAAYEQSAPLRLENLTVTTRPSA